MTKKKTQSKAAKFKSDMKKYNKGKSVKEKFFTLSPRRSIDCKIL